MLVRLLLHVLDISALAVSMRAAGRNANFVVSRRLKLLDSLVLRSRFAAGLCFVSLRMLRHGGCVTPSSLVELARSLAMGQSTKVW
jgi:hypothetical protein